MSDELPPPPERRRSGAVNRARRLVSTSVTGPQKKISIDPDIFMAVLFVVILLLGGGVALLLNAQRGITANQESIQEQQKLLSFVERRDRINSYQTAFRFCSRINNDRAALHYLVGSNKPPERAQRRLRRLERKEGLPILDCRPNVSGDPATYLSPVEQRAFVERWRRGDLTAAEVGICRVRIGTLKPPGTCDP